jgi:hypothetical protein
MLGLAVAAPVLAQDALTSAAELQQRLDLSALAAHAKAQPVEARLAAAQAAALKSLGRDFGRTGSQAALMQGWQAYLAANRPAPDDVNALVALVLRESCLQAAADLKQQAEKAKAANQQKARIRTQAKQPGAGSATGTPTVRPSPGAMQMQMQSPGDDAQLANVDLQNVMQRSQQNLQMMANIAKTMNDTAMAVIRGMK